MSESDRTGVDVLVAGRVYSDLVFTGVQAPAPGTEVFASSVTLSPGGAANRAVAAARLGSSASLLATLGDDPIGIAIQSMLQAEPGLDLSTCARPRDVPNPISVAITDGEERAFVTYELPDARPEWPLERDAAVAHIGVLDDAPAWVEVLRSRGTLVVGGLGWDASGVWSTGLLDRLDHVDVLIVNEAEALGYTRSPDAHQALRILGGRVATAVVTRGPLGAIALEAGRIAAVPAIPVRAIDPTGAGDVFSAAFMSATAAGWDLEQRLRLASAAATCSVRAPGGAASAPRPADLVDLLADRPRGDGWTAVAEWAADPDRPALSRPTPTPQETA